MMGRFLGATVGCAEETATVGTFTRSPAAEAAAQGPGGNLDRGTKLELEGSSMSNNAYIDRGICASLEDRSRRKPYGSLGKEGQSCKNSLFLASPAPSSFVTL
jgi:hypothetical protein